MAEANVNLSANLKLRTAEWVTASKEAAASTKVVTEEAKNLDRTVNQNLQPNLAKTGQAARKMAEDFGAARGALFGYEEATRRAVVATERMAVTSQRARAAIGDISKDVGRGVLASGISSTFGDSAAGQFFGGATASALSKVPVVAGAVAAIAAVTLGMNSLLNAVVGVEEAITAETQARWDAVNSATATRVAAEDRVQQLSGEPGRFQSLIGNRRESLSIYEAQLSDSTAKLASARESLARESSLLAQAEGRIAQLTAARANASSSASGSIASMALSTIGGESASLAQVAMLARQGRASQTAGNQDAAREKFAEAIQIIEALYQSLGAPADRLGEFSAAIASLQAEIDASFVASLDAASATATTAAGNVASLTTEVAALQGATASAAGNIASLNAQIASLSAQWAASTKQLADAEAALRAANLTEGQTIASAVTATSAELGMANGGKVHDPRDVIPALLRDGETVLTPEHTKKLAPYLAAAGVPGFADGGYASLLAGTRNFTTVAQGAGIADDDVEDVGWRRMVNDAMRLGMTYQQAQAVVARRRAAGLPPVFPGYTPTPSVGSQITAGLQGFANGGKVGGSQMIHVDSVNVDYRSQGGTERDARALARELRVQIARGAASLG